MGKLIDSDELMKYVEKPFSSSWDKSVFRDVIERQPEVKVQREAVAEIKIDEEKLKEIIKQAFDELKPSLPNDSTVGLGGWIRLEERLPKKNKKVLISRKNGVVSTAYLTDLSNFPYKLAWLYDNCYHVLEMAQAWQPLPEPYQEGEK